MSDSDGTVLFQSGSFSLHAGQKSNYKIECDALTPQDVFTLSILMAERLSPYGRVEGVARGGLRFAVQMALYATEGPLLIVDDVWTTGVSMEAQRDGRDAIGVVVFARNPVASWVTPLFQMTPQSGRADG